MPVDIEVRGLDEVQRKLARFPALLDAEMRETMTKALLHTQSSVPAYPPPPPNSTYKRKGAQGLGGSLGVGMNGGRIGNADIYKVEKVGSGYEGHFGSKLSYAGRVIGEVQDPFFAAYWWNIKTVAKNAQKGIERLFKLMGDRVASKLNS